MSTALEGPTPGFLVWRLSMKWRVAVDRAVAPLGLTHAQYSLLGSLLGLQRSGLRPSQRQLADHTGLEPLYVSKLARTLEGGGLLDRDQDPADTRAVQLSLTAYGRAVTSRATGVVQQLLDQLLAPLGGLGGQRTELFARELAVLLDAPLDPDRGVTMSTTPTLTPQVIGQAENAHRPLMDRVLARTGTTFHQWVALTITAAGGRAVDRDQLVGRVAGALKISDAAVLATIAELTASELLEARPGEGVRVGLTDAGQARYHQIRAAVDEVTARVYRDLPADDLATAGRVLTVITARANAELADDQKNQSSGEDAR